MTRIRTCWRLFLCAILASLLPLVPSPLLPTPAAQAQTSASQFLRDISALSGQIEDAQVWTVGGGYLYWARCGSYLRRWPIAGGRATTIANGSLCVNSSLVADDSGLWYYDSTARKIMHRSVSDPFTAQPVADSGAPTGAILLDKGDNYLNDYIYWLENGAIRSADKSDFKPFNAQPEPLGTGANNLTINGNELVYFANGYLYSLQKICLGFGGGGICQKTPLFAATGNYLNHAVLTEETFFTRITPFWVNGSEIQGHWCLSPCRTTTAYTAPTVNSISYQPGKLASDGQYMFWIEYQCVGSGETGYCTSDGRLMKWNLRQAIESNPFDSPQQIACRDCGATYTIGNKGENIGVAGGWVFFETSRGITRIRADAPPVNWDLALNGMEVTQGVQGLPNDVLLVGDKPTYVRVYGNKLSGPNVYGVDATLSATGPTGAALPGSPLHPLNGVQNFTDNNLPIARGDPGKSWIFRLPDSWVAAGTISLRPRIDPNRTWRDPNTLNNIQLATSFTFARKAPICVVFIPVRTNPRVQMFTPAHWFAINMVKRQLPTPDVWVYHQDNDVAELEARFGIPPWKYGPYEMADDSSKVLASLLLRDKFSDDPDRCDDARARTHYVGVVSADAGGANGTGMLDGDQLWFRVPPDNFSQDWMTDRAVSFAHELGHNYGRRHVNCPEDDPDDTAPFPYPTCQIDQDDGPNRHYGFTYNAFSSQFQAIAPTSVGDLMSYAHRLDPSKSRWISDFTWGGMFNEIPNGATAQRADAAPQAVAPAAPKLAAAGSVVLISGVINTATPAATQLDHAWVLTTAALSQRTLHKWQRSAAPAVSYAQAGTRAAGSYHLRLLDAGGNVLDDRAITFEESADDDGTNKIFQLTFPAPTGQVARLDVMDGETVLASKAIGESQPTVQVIAPAGGESFDQTMTLSWRASDANPGDKLLYTVQYSPNNGQSWRAVLTNLPNLGSTDTISVPLANISGLPSSAGSGLIRVLASDGYNTAIAVSKPFSIPSRKPEPMIISPWAGQSVPVAQPILVQGTALDADDGSLSGTALRWAVDSNDVGTGQQIVIGELTPGPHVLSLTATDTAGSAQIVTTTFTVEPLRIPLAAAPTLDGACTDDVYANAGVVHPSPYDDGSQPTVRLLRSDSYLWACYTGLTRAAASARSSLAVMRVDVNHSRDAAPQPDDYGFLIGEDGLLDTFKGNGTSGSLDAAGPGGLDGRVGSTGSGWSAEIRIDASVLGGWNKIVGLDVEQVYATENSTQYWPHTAKWNNPASWATTMFGDLPQVSTLAPATATAGGSDFTLTINGSGFLAGTVVRWGGVDKPTTVVSATQLQATISAADLATPRTVPITVAYPGGIESNALPFFVSPVAITVSEPPDNSIWLPIVRR